MEALLKIMEKYKKTDIADFGIMDFKAIDEKSFIDCRAKLRLPKNPCSVICMAFPYYVGEFKEKNVASYSMLQDYHQVILDTLSKICDELSKEYNGEFVGFTDISPLPEAFCSVLAGIGFMGKNNLLITKQWGSYVILGEIVTDIKFDFSNKNEKSCLNCGLCIKNCPNNAITKKGIDYNLCLSNISQTKGELEKEQVEALKKNGFAWGCDRCQEVCPHNKDIKKTHIKEFLNDIEPILNDENLDKLIKTRAYGYKGKTLLKRNLDIINSD